MAMSAGDSALKAAVWPAALREAAMAPTSVSFILEEAGEEGAVQGRTLEPPSLRSKIHTPGRVRHAGSCHHKASSGYVGLTAPPRIVLLKLAGLRFQIRVPDLGVNSNNVWI